MLDSSSSEAPTAHLLFIFLEKVSKLLLSAVPITDLPFGFVLPNRPRSHSHHPRNRSRSLSLEFVAVPHEGFVVNVPFSYRAGDSF
jgi:hypothetical protein